MDSPNSEAMFGDMFEEPEKPVIGCSPNPNLKTNGKGVEAPPPMRGETGFCGIKNQGATCYLNSLIQTLLLTPELREELFRLGPDELGKLEDLKKKSAKVRIIPIQLQMLLARLLLLNQYACGTESLTESFGWVDSEELQQHDVQELSRILFCAIEDSLIGTSGRDVIKNLYRGVTANTISCLSCRKTSERTEEFLDLNIAIAAQNNLTAVLRDMFVEKELMNGKNQYHCENCAKLVDARKGAIIKTLPPILTISLLRFSFDYTTLRRFKETGRFEFPLSLSMKPYCEENSEGQCYDYELYSTIIHSGSAHGGHYHAYIRDIDGLGKVPADYNPNPPRVDPSSPEKVDGLSGDYIEDPIEMLAYVLGKLGGENVPMNKLGEAFREESGTSWGKQYKRKYGTMTKFLQSCYDTFTVDNRSKTVSFRTKSQSKVHRGEEVNHSSTHNGVTETENGSGDADPESKKPPKSPTVDGNLGCSGEGDACGIARNGNGFVSDDLDQSFDYHPLCNVWFDFNDSHVKPITTHDIEKQFEGRESAYMLFYRRKDLRRPLESLGNARNGIPDYIRAQIQEENSSLDERRTEYDFLLNVVSLRVFFPTMFKRENGLIKIIENDDKESAEYGFAYSIDRRKTVGDMMSELKQMAEKHSEENLLESENQLQCNVLKVLSHKGVHFYDRIDSDLDVVIGESLLENGQMLILWDGGDFHDMKICPGHASEPIVLNVHCKMCGGNDVQSFDFNGVSFGNVTLLDLKNHFLEKFKVENVTNSTIGRAGENNTLLVFSEEEMNETLAEVKASHEDSFHVELTLDDKETDVDGASIDSFTLNVALGGALKDELCSNGYFGFPHDTFVMTSITGVVKASSFFDVKHLKLSILRCLFPDTRSRYELEKLHLYVDENVESSGVGSSKLGLHEQQSLIQAGVTKDVSCVRLEIGPPPEKKEFHVTVYIQKGSKLKLPMKKCQAIEVICIKTKPVSCFIDKILAQLNLPKDSRHLKILKSEKEVGDIISSPDLPVERTQIKHGSALILCPGSVPSEGQVRIPIWYHPELQSFDDVLIRIRDNPTLSVWHSILNEDETKPVSVGHVELEKEATLFDLKRKIAELEYFQNEGLTMVEAFCLRSIIHKLPTRYHLQETSSVKRLRFGPNTPLAVQKSSTMPESSKTSLYLSFQVPGTRIYTNFCQIQLENTCSLAQLHNDISSKLNISAKEILMAKRGEESWEWEIIKTRDTDSKTKEQKNNTKVKKGGKQKKNQSKVKNKKTIGKSSQILPQHGDVIRVKLIDSRGEDGPEVSDFRSDEDILMLKKWQDSRHKESSPQPQEEVKESNVETSPSETKKKPSKPKKEEILRIHVDKF